MNLIAPGGHLKAIYRRQMDDEAWLPAPATWWRLLLNRVLPGKT
jgi:hypothetical protein